ncbi:uncharacterized protein LOC135114141 isoform X2 [Scylla paramamosain]|uniref:uncharacterized protein LOC135114141 isoform X2 n=1 Tax=Scylla paramamosain TaxID=85552 RepID=UPI0030835B67
MATEDHSLTKHQTNNHVKKKRKCITKEKDKLADGTLITSHTQKLDKRSGKQKRQENTAADPKRSLHVSSYGVHLN